MPSVILYMPSTPATFYRYRAMGALFEGDHVYQVLEALLGSPGKTFHNLGAVGVVGLDRLSLPSGKLRLRQSLLERMWAPHDA